MKKITGRMAAIAASIALTASVVSLSVYALNRTKGDVTGDGKVTQADAVWAARKADGQDIGDVPFDELAADVDFNGKFDSADAQAIAKYVAGWNDTSVGDSITESDPIYTLSIKYRDDIDKSVQDNELEAAVAYDEELMMRFLYGAFDDLSEYTKFKGGLTLEEAYAMARMLPDFYVDIDAFGNKADMILTRGFDGYSGSEDVKTVKLTACVAGGTAPYTYEWYKGNHLECIDRVYETSVTGNDNYNQEVYCKIKDAKGNTLTTNPTTLRNTDKIKLVQPDYKREWYAVGVVDLPKYTYNEQNDKLTLHALVSGGTGFTDFKENTTVTPDEVIDGVTWKTDSYYQKIDPSRYTYKVFKRSYSANANADEILGEGNVTSKQIKTMTYTDISTYDHIKQYYYWDYISWDLDTTLSHFTTNTKLGNNGTVTDSPYGAYQYVFQVTDKVTEVTAEIVFDINDYNSNPGKVETIADNSIKPMFVDPLYEFPDCYANSGLPTAGVESYAWNVSYDAPVTFAVQGGTAPYKFSWYVDGKLDHGWDDSLMIQSAGGAYSNTNSSTVSYDVRKYLGKTGKCVVTDANGQTVESNEFTILMYELQWAIKPAALEKHSVGASANPLICRYNSNIGEYEIKAGFNKGSLVWSDYKTTIYIKVDGAWKKYATMTGLGISNTGLCYMYQDGYYIFKYIPNFTELKKAGFTETTENFRIVIEDSATNSSLEYIAALKENHNFG